ncbi:BcsE family c-di-GMP-binding protein [Caballeronia sp. LZ062]|uniref:BcsE family c-di-GMP-binding protein n=1 Tax=unclassified Caballeronia TaxID=2646786 RepID=UPI002854F7A5|nr:MULTISPECIES: BcsE family c-di-GMP-binding protein [unclassified Caballeronia]MDR5856204.1 BcsE family c-di-GMP-binding protein [Caballeronia sp. LZ050]MDR5872875.1 BcsE family c-di-GMP-binding protein [Caballeronia sp. LZ062]
MNDATFASFGGTTRGPARWLAGLRASVRRAPRGRHAPRLAIDGLPEKWAAFAPGAVHGLYTTPGTRACDALIWDTAREGGSEHVTVVRALPRDEVAAQLRARGLSADERAPGWPRYLNVLALPDEESGVPLRVALRALVRRGLRSRSLSIIEGAERWFTWDDPAALSREGDFLARWCAKRRVSLLLIFRAEPVETDLARPPMSPANPFETSGTLHMRFAGVARMGELAGELRWHVDFWRTGQTLAANETCALRLNASGALVAELEPPSHGRIPARLSAADAERVVVTRSLVGAEAWLPADWEPYADNAAVFAACRDAHAASIVFALDPDTPLADLCAMIHSLRKRRGGALKIAVALRGHGIGLHHELLLLRVGADAVLPRDLPFSRLSLALRSLQGHLHTGPIVDDPAAALAAAQPDALSGYAPLAGFCDRVAAVLQRGHMLALPHVLVELTVRDDVSHLDALCATLSRQPGRIATVDATHVYVFLFACEPPEAHDRLGPLLDAPGAELFSDRKLYVGSGIVHRLDVMREHARHTQAPDYSDVLPVAPASLPRLTPVENAPARALHRAPVAVKGRTEDGPATRPHAQRCALPIRREVGA